MTEQCYKHRFKHPQDCVCVRVLLRINEEKKRWDSGKPPFHKHYEQRSVTFMLAAESHIAGRGIQIVIPSSLTQCQIKCPCKLTFACKP